MPAMMDAAAATPARLLTSRAAALSEAGVFRMTAPRRFGGFEADFTTRCDVLAHVARGSA
jgi:hypothetical protein